MNIKIALTLTTLLTMTAPAVAAVSCRADYEAIVTLKPPVMNTPTVWDARFGVKDSMIRLGGGAMIENDHLLLAGQEVDQDGKAVRTVLAELDKRARILGDKRIPAMNAEQQAGIVTLDTGGTVIASTVTGGKKNNEKSVRLARFGKNRAYQSSLTLGDKVYNYTASGMSALSGGKGILVAVQAVSRRDSTDEYGIIARIGAGGKTIWKRAYRSGAAGQIYGITASAAGNVAAGRVRADDGRMSGWLMALNDDGTILWQNVFARGQTAFFRSATPRPGSDHVIAAGQVTPYGDAPAALWVMETDGAGNVLWQRYFRNADYNFDPRSVTLEQDGRISVMVNAAARQNATGTSNHIRLLTLTPRGDVLADGAYMQGRSAVAVQYAPQDNGERVVFASIDSFGDSNGKDNELIISQMARRQFVGPVRPEKTEAAKSSDALIRQGWVFAATPLEPYNDPCAPPPPRKSAP